MAGLCVRGRLVKGQAAVDLFRPSMATGCATLRTKKGCWLGSLTAEIGFHF
jgi:hypothetical protein